MDSPLRSAEEIHRPVEVVAIECASTGRKKMPGGAVGDARGPCHPPVRAPRGCGALLAGGSRRFVHLLRPGIDVHEPGRGCFRAWPGGSTSGIASYVASRMRMWRNRKPSAPRTADHSGTTRFAQQLVEQ